MKMEIEYYDTETDPPPKPGWYMACNDYSDMWMDAYFDGKWRWGDCADTTAAPRYWTHEFPVPGADQGSDD